MKSIYKFLSLLVAAVWMFSACQPDDFSMGAKDVSPEDLEEGIAYTIEFDATTPNVVYLKSKMDSRYTPVWNHPQGRSQDKVVTLKLPFAGTYKVQFGVLTRGGVVYAQETSFTLDQMNTDFIKDPLWTLLTGGVGKSKTWMLDLNADAVSKYFLGPLYFYGTEDSWESLAMYAAGSSGDKVKEVLGISDTWNWSPDYKGNSWLMSTGDYGTMTFDLIDGANLTVDHKMLGRAETGTFMMDAEKHTMRTTDAFILHDAGRDGQVIDWGNIKILSLTETSMQLAVLRDPVLSGDGACLLVYNFISKEYSDAWTPGEVAEPEPALPNNWEDDVNMDVSYIRKWVLSASNPFNWAKLDGSLMNNWNTPAEYPEWTGFNASVPASYANFSLTLNSKENTVAYVAPDGTKSAGTYALDEKGFYTFSGVTPAFNICGGVNLATSADNQWRILKIEKDELGSLTGMWVGVRDPQKPEYMAFHLIPQSGSATVDPAEQIKKMLCAQTWALDANRQYNVATSWGAEQGPVIFSDYATWFWNPKPGEHPAAGEAAIDYGSMKFATNGTFVVKQRKRVYTFVEEGETKERAGSPKDGDVLASDEELTINGTWSYDNEDKTITMSAGMLHPWTYDYAVADWGAVKLYKVEANAVLLQVTRSKELSGEDAMPLTYIFVPKQ